MGLIGYFINKILKSSNVEDENMKKKLIKKLNKEKDEEGFLYRFPKSLKHLEEKKKSKKEENKNNKNKNNKNKNEIKNKKKKKIEEKEKK